MTTLERLLRRGQSGAGEAVDVMGDAGADPASPTDQALDALAVGIVAADVLGLDTTGAKDVLREGRERLGLVADAYVVAFVGGTGVGKSTLLNALAGEEVSPASARRPTTAAPIAWVSERIVDEVRPLLDRLGVDRRRTHRDDGLGSLVVVDMPDLDSLEPSHRAIVDELLPKVDVVAWVTDPEKYADAVLHDDYVREWLPRLDRQAVVLNKSDRLDGAGPDAVAADLRRVIGRDVPILAVTAFGGVQGLAPLRDWLAAGVEAKEVVAARIGAAARATLAQLTAAAGTTAGVHDLVSEPVRRKAVDEAVAEVARLLDMETLERQAIGATRARARRRGTGPIGILTSALYRYSGRQRRAADPAEHLRAWRARGGLARVTELVRRAISDALPGVPPALRPRYASAAEAQDLATRLERRMDRMVEGTAAMASEPPSSRWWPFFGLLQSINTVVLIAAVAWVVLWVIARPEVASYDLPVLGPVPVPLLLLAGAVVAGFVLARALSWHARWLGKRFGRRLEVHARIGAREVIEGEAFSPLDRLEDARLRLSGAYRQVERLTTRS